MPKESPNELIARYNAARKIAGAEGDGMPLWRAHNGWYSIGYGKYRRAQVEGMIANLLRRAEDDPSPADRGSP